jgi:hypothetical protein
MSAGKWHRAVSFVELIVSALTPILLAAAIWFLVDVTGSMLEELDKAARDLNVSRQAVIKRLVRQALDQHYLARRSKQPQPPS